MAGLPSYEDAIGRLDWLELVAPYVLVTDLGRLCSVNRRFYRVFAPRLWNDPLPTVRTLGLQQSDDLDWYLHFIFKRASWVRPSTLALVTTLDFRDFAKQNTVFWSDDSQRSIPETFKRLPALFPNLRCILIDGHTDADPVTLAVAHAATPPPDASGARHHRPLLLSIPQTEALLPTIFFTSDYVRDLVYLDVSRLPGSLQSLVAAVHGTNHLPHLKILKICGRELNDATAETLFSVFRGKLWSTDLADNLLTDAVIPVFAARCFLSPRLRGGDRFYEEGRLLRPENFGSAWYGPFQVIEESRWSVNFSHPERHFADTPAYSAESRSVLQEHEAVRANGRGSLKRDTSDHIKIMIAGNKDHAPPSVEDVPHLDVCRSPIGITHLDLTGNRISAGGLDRLIRTTPGQLEQLAYDEPVFKSAGTPWPPAWHRETSLHGIIGSAHVFRPVFSSNLRVLRIHHSLVTGILSLETPGLSTMARLWIAETSIRDRCEMAYPETFEPDMNPRLTSLTLTKLPRRSAGPLTAKLIRFLRLAAVQEQAINGAGMGSTSRRSPVVLRGLRHLRLEFEADPIEDPAGWSNADDLDAEDLLNMDDGEGFSFFQDENKPRSQPNSDVKPDLPPRRAAAGAAPVPVAAPGSETSGAPDPHRPADPITPPSVRLRHAPYSETSGEHVDQVIEWNGSTSKVKVWIGSGVLGPHPAVNAYMQALSDPALRDHRVGPAMPAHQKAGVPMGQVLFYAAWDSMIMPTQLMKPGRADLHKMGDVIEALRAFRTTERTKYEAKQASHDFWAGKLEVVSQQSMAHYRSSQYWR
ncbi:hypothetical protein F5X68DRAFT_32768 [Plectosphaerella plurivora]|uniref:Uncharacterized protein n=1 Tax=Plectosphaerella plurivora TaxID=936078 RepID=A0A9P9A9P5_9PEZI|nr:hypothetical protein F5X68DRAFT_32768 [Plectosphaerella plurivora]